MTTVLKAATQSPTARAIAVCLLRCAVTAVSARSGTPALATRSSPTCSNQSCG
jgi:hypothetical protein